MKTKIIFMKKMYVFILTIIVALTSCKSSQYKDLGDGLFAGIKTNKGDIVVRLEHEKTPVTVANFISLSEGKNPFVDKKYQNKPYYDGITFHRVIKDFMIQGGDPTGTGSGSPGYNFMDETNNSLTHNKKGILSMANSGPATNGSQFFITHDATPWLNGKHTIFGEVVKGLNIVDSIANVKVGTNNKPTVDVVMNTIEIIRNGEDANNFDAASIMKEYFDKEFLLLAELEKEKAKKAETALKAKEAMKVMIANQHENAKELPSGLKILNLNDNTNEKPKIGQKVLVMYAGYLEDGSLFDSNYKEIATKYNKFDANREQGGGYEPVPMLYSPEARLIAGFKEGLLTMKVGDKVRFFIPPHLGYGEQGSGNVIPPQANLVFDVEIKGIVPTETQEEKKEEEKKEEEKKEEEKKEEEKKEEEKKEEEKKEEEKKEE